MSSVPKKADKLNLSPYLSLAWDLLKVINTRFEASIGSENSLAGAA